MGKKPKQKTKGGTEKKKDEDKKKNKGEDKDKDKDKKKDDDKDDESGDDKNKNEEKKDEDKKDDKKDQKDDDGDGGVCDEDEEVDAGDGGMDEDEIDVGEDKTGAVGKDRKTREEQTKVKAKEGHPQGEVKASLKRETSFISQQMSKFLREFLASQVSPGSREDPRPSSSYELTEKTSATSRGDDGTTDQTRDDKRTNLRRREASPPYKMEGGSPRLSQTDEMPLLLLKAAAAEAGQLPRLKTPAAHKQVLLQRTGSTDAEGFVNPGVNISEGQVRVPSGADGERSLQVAPGVVAPEGKIPVAPGATEGQTCMTPGATEGQTHMAPRATEGQTLMALGATEGQTHMAPGAIEGQTFMAPGATEGHTHMALGATDEQTLMGPGTTEGQTHMALGATDEQTLMGPGTTEGQTHMALGATEGQTLMALGATEGQTHMAPGAIEGQTHMATGAMAVQAHMAPGTNVLSGHRQTLSGIVTSKDYTHPPPGLTTSGYTTLSTSGGAPHIPSVVLTTSHPPAPETLTPGLPSVPHGVVTPAHASHIPGFTATGHLPMTPGVLTSGHTPVSQVIVAQHGTAAPGVMASGHGPSFTEVMATGHAPVSTGIIATGHAPSSAGLSTTQHILQPPLDTTMTVRSTQIPPGRYTANDGTTYVVMSDQQYYPEGQSAADVLNFDVVPGNPSKAEVSTVRRMLRRIKAIERRKGWNELSYLRVGFRDVIVEPEAMFTPKFLRLYTACLYSFLLSSVYAVFTFLLAPVLAVVYGITFAVVAFFGVWVFGPVFRVYKTLMAAVYRCLEVLCFTFIAPVMAPIGLCFSNIFVKYQKIVDDPSALPPDQVVKIV